MGVPKFFRYMSERYPCLSELVKEYQIPEFDNLYLDMNGIIHICSHPDDFDAHFRISEEKIMSDIFHYIEVLFRMIKPQKLFFMAVDGVAPRAKMNQQRGRRFRSAKDAEVLEQKAKEKGEELPSEARFDSNCITPGTVFMVRLQEQLKYFVTAKISTDSLWQKCRIILSGHETPGEGEHKIMDYIRYMKAQPGYNPNTRHCLYGLDADLIMLGLCTHEPHFSLLREEVRFGKKAKRTNVPEHITFYLLHLSLMREYLELEFLPLKDSLPFQYDMEKIIDDWVLMGFLVGNDFIPHLPNLHITNGALPILYNAYMKILPTLDGYINEAGNLNLERFEKFMVALASIDMTNFSEQYADLKYFQSKTGQKLNGKDRTSCRLKDLQVWTTDENDVIGDFLLEPKTINRELEALIKSTDELLIDYDSNPKTEKKKNPELELLIKNTEEMFADPITSTSESNTEVTNEENSDSKLDPEMVDAIIRAVDKMFSQSNPDQEIDDPIFAVEELSEESKIETEEEIFKGTKEDDETSQNNKLIDLNVDKSTLDEKSENCEIVDPINSADTSEEKKIEEVVEVKLVEPSQENLEELAIDLIDLEDDNADAMSNFYSETESDEDEELMTAEFLQHKNDYYMNKLDYSKVTPEVMRVQAEGYVRAIQWNLHYYYNGVCSWSWYYPHHYAPYISDIKDFKNLILEYELGEPFKPFEQLLAVLPAASKSLLPEPYQSLMISEDSLIIEYYPQDFKTDLNGKRQEWEAVVLIPFIEEDLLLKAMAPCNEQLSEEEKKRNTHGPMLIYEYCDENLGILEAPAYFPKIDVCNAKCTLLTIEDIKIPKDKLVKGPCPGAITDVYYPGFPTLKHLKYKAHLEKAKVRVFDFPSLNENMIITIIPDNKDQKDLTELTKELIGQTVYVAWPHLVEAMVVGVTDDSLWNSQKQGITQHYKERLGIDVGETSVFIFVKTLCGTKYVCSQDGTLDVEKQWTSAQSIYPLQATIKNLVVSEDLLPVFQNIQDLFPLSSKCFMLGHPHYGSMGEVIDNTSLKGGRIKVSVNATLEPDLTPVLQFQQEMKYMLANVASKRLAISPHLLSRITGTIFVVPGRNASEIQPNNSNKVNIGLNLKLNKKNEEIPGYTKRVDGMWFYSPKAVQLVHDYMVFAPELFNYLQLNLGNNVFYESEIFSDDSGKDKLKGIIDWLKKQPFSSIVPQKVGSKTVDIEIVKKIEEIVDNFHSKQASSKQVIMQVKPHLLYKPGVQKGFLPADPSTKYHLYDRVVNIRESYTVPFGCKGTVIGIQVPAAKTNGEDDMETMYDVVFDRSFPGGLQLNCSHGRGYRLPKPALINISHGIRVVQQKTLNPVTNAPWYSNTTPLNRNHSTGPQVMYRPPNSAFLDWNTSMSAHKNYMHHPHIFPSPSMHHTTPLPNVHHIRPMVMNQGPPIHQHRPIQQHPQGAGAEFHAFFQDLQKNQSKARQPNMPTTNVNAFNKNQQITGGASSSINQFNTQSQNYVQKSAAVSSYQKGPTDETEALKKLLKISEKNSPTHGAKERSPTKESKKSPQQISVHDIFAHARNKEQSMNSSQTKQTSPQYSVQLLNYCQSKGIGIPRYNYFTVGESKFRAQIILPNGKTMVSDETATKEEATENAAKKIIDELFKVPNGAVPHLNQKQSTSAPNLGPHGFPIPPKQWCQNESSKSHTKPNKQIIKNDQTASTKQQIVSVSRPEVNKKAEAKGGQNSQCAAFVPLQAVKQHRHKSSTNNTDNRNNTSAGSSSKSHTKGNSGNKSKNSPHVSPVKNKSSASGDKDKHQQGDSGAKPKVRKSRIAANFAGFANKPN